MWAKLFRGNADGLFNLGRPQDLASTRLGPSCWLSLGKAGIC